ncbi:MAG: hypothetical protein JXQ65_16340 [Candidatus Marinimicrobia bacterium]|nr:hypothetical protein [Candidatus Neomarinimicrobiota bacterium]
MISKTTNKFWKCYKPLLKAIKKYAKESFTLFKKDPNYPGLNFKKVHKKLPVFSVRITSDYRALGIVKENEILWFWIGTHNDYENIIKKSY